MRLTERGRDYLLGILLLEAAGLATGASLFAALALALAFASLVSMVLLGLLAPRSLNVSVLDDHIRLFKRQEGRLEFSLQGKRDSWTSLEVESVASGESVETSVLSDGEHFVARVKPTKAGRFVGFKVDVRLGDAIGLFSVRRQVVLDRVVLDSLPISLLGREATRRPLPVVIGESPAGQPGKGQEFYGIEVYGEQSESRDILWKRAAYSPHGPLLARVREANSPESIGILVVQGEMGGVRRADCIDLQCEALGLLGGTLLASRLEVVIIGPDGVGRPARNDTDLADAIMEISGAGESPARGKVRTAGLEIVVAVGDFSEGELSHLGRRPAIFIGTRGNHPMDRYAMDFTGDEDLSEILGLALAR